MATRRDEQWDAEIIALYHSGLNMAEIGKGVGLSRERVRQILRRSGVETRRGWLRVSTANPPRRWREAQARERKRMKREWRWRLAVWVVRDLAAELHDAPTHAEITSVLFGRPRHPTILHSYLDASKTPTPAALLMQELFTAAGTGHIRRRMRPDYRRKTAKTICEAAGD